ncbi:MAG: YqzK family protein [Bacillus sp. (in: Bacteria)]|nr:YqzK family protein [Bacillus sp. (in: firmicutes)]
MISYLSAILQTIKVFIIFTGCTVLFYYGIMLVNEEYQNYHRYDEPKGAALKVSNAVEDENFLLLNRLKLFYLNGE